MRARTALRAGTAIKEFGERMALIPALRPVCGLVTGLGDAVKRRALRQPIGSM